MTAHGILAMWHDCEVGREEEYEVWYQTEHLFERLGVPGFLFGRRLEAVSGTPRFFNFYVTETPDVLTSEPYLARLNDPTPLTRSVMSKAFKNMTRTVCRRAARAGRFRGSTVVTARFSERGDRSALISLVDTLSRGPAVASAEFWEAVELGGGSVSSEERLRGGDQRITGCLTVEMLRQDEAKVIASDFSRQLPDADVGVYAMLCEIGRGDI
jgi:hypothetical protein